MANMGALLALLSLFAARAIRGRIDNVRVLGPQAVNLWQLDTCNDAERASAAHAQLLVQQAGDISASDTLSSEDGPDELLGALERKFPARWLTQPLDHFTNASGHTFEQWYWISTRHYRPRPDAPVIVLDGGETSGRDRLPFLDTGIMEILTEAMGGAGVILEHRYYGASCSSLRTEPGRYRQAWSCGSDDSNAGSLTQLLGRAGRTIPVQKFTTDSLR